MSPTLRAGIDAHAFAALEQHVFQPPWGADAFPDGDGHVGLGAYDGVRCVGFVFGRLVLDEAELWRIATAADFRRRGLATRLYHAFAETLRARGAARVFLEVEADNTAAVAFYIARGFVGTGRRRAYYGAGRDALLMAAALDPMT